MNRSLPYPMHRIVLAFQLQPKRYAVDLLRKLGTVSTNEIDIRQYDFWQAG